MPPKGKLTMATLQRVLASSNARARVAGGTRSTRYRALGQKRGLRKGQQTTNNALKELMNRKYTFLPWSKSCIMPMSSQVTLTASGTQSVFGNEYVFRLNSLYTPQIIPAGAPSPQPNGFASAGAQYKKYQVYACGIELEFFNPSDDGLVVGVFIQGNQAGAQALTALTTTAADSKQGCATYSMANTGSQKLVKRFYCPIHVLEGLSKLSFKVQQDNYSALVNANPATACYLRIAVANTVDTAAETVQCMVRLNYYTMFSQKVTDTQASVTSG